MADGAGRAGGARRAGAEAVVLEHTVVVQATFELAGLGHEPVLPAGLAPTVPTLLTFLAVHVPDGPLGPLSFAQARLSCRSGVRARALVVASEVEGTARRSSSWPRVGGSVAGRCRSPRSSLRPGDRRGAGVGLRWPSLTPPRSVSVTSSTSRASTR